MKCLYIYNPKSGKMQNESLANFIQKKLKTCFQEVAIKPTQKQGDAGLFASDACGKYDSLVVAGGDGTINEVINAIATKANRPNIGIIPTGTANDLAHSLKIPNNINKALKIILKGETISHDIFRINNRYGIYVCAFGIFTKASYQTEQIEKKKLGYLAYVKFGIKELFSSNSFKVSIQTEDTTITGDYALGLITNSRYVAGQKVNGKANLSDGYVDIVLVEATKKKVTIKPLMKIAKLFMLGINNLNKFDHCKLMHLNKFRVILADDITTNIDGEKGENGSFEFEVLPKHVEIYVKSKNNSPFKEIVKRKTT